MVFLWKLGGNRADEPLNGRWPFLPMDISNIREALLVASLGTLDLNLWLWLRSPSYSSNRNTFVLSVSSLSWETLESWETLDVNSLIQFMYSFINTQVLALINRNLQSSIINLSRYTSPQRYSCYYITSAKGYWEISWRRNVGVYETYSSIDGTRRTCGYNQYCWEVNLRTPYFVWRSNLTALL